MATNEIATILLLGSFVVLIFMRVPIGFALGLSSIITTWYLDLPLLVVAQGIVRGIDVFVLLAVPFFIIAGEIMGAGGISARLVGLANALVGRFRGGLAMVNVLASTFIPSQWLSAEAFRAFALDFIVLGNGYLERRRNRLGFRR